MDYIIILALIAFVAIGIVYTVKHFKGQGGCCGGGGYKPRKKKLACVAYQKTFKVEGMHCVHCKTRVEEIVNDIKDVCGSIDLKKGELTVSYAEDVEDSLLLARLAKAGYPASVIE